ncbi:MAG: hypothetical protein WDN26_17745 [Chitinophagaceae bacterium]
MEKYLFNDGTNVIREVESKEELTTLIQAVVDPGKVRIWIFNTSEWVSYSEFVKHPAFKNSIAKKLSTPPVFTVEEPVIQKPVKRFGWLKKSIIGIIAAAAIFLVYNFTKVKWTKISAIEITAARPANTPVIDADSLIQTIELTRGKKLDKITATNLRIRNTWPDRLELKLSADRDTSNAGLQYSNIKLSIDNSTGYTVESAIAEVTVWKNSNVVNADTLHFKNITYAAAAERSVNTSYRGDSISVAFTSIKSKAFNFCYSSDKKSNYGNLNDRWFCRD